MKKPIVTLFVVLITFLGYALCSYTSLEKLGVGKTRINSIDSLPPNNSVNSSLTKYCISFYKNQERYITIIDDGIIGQPSPLVAENVRVLRTAKYFTKSLMPPAVMDKMLISPGMTFYSGLQSNNNDSEWIFVERDMRSSAYNLCHYDHKEGIKTKIFDEESSPETLVEFKPIAWSIHSSSIYLEAIVFGSSTEHEGIWSYDILNKKSNRINISLNYSNTPQISPDGRYLLYCVTDKQKDIHVPSRKVMIFDLEANLEILVDYDNAANYTRAEWVEIITK